MTSHLTGTRPLLTVSLRQDARNIAPWVVLISVLSASSVLGYNWIFTTMAERQELAATLGANPALSLVFGPARDLMTAEGFNNWRAGQLGALFAGIMAILVVTRNSREREDSGQAELIASGVTGRHTRLMVAVLMAAVASVALGIVCSLLTIVVGGGALATVTLAATFTASGLVFGALAAVTAQLGSDARASSSLAIAALGALFALRGYLDSSGAAEWTVWLTPFGWLERTVTGAASGAPSGVLSSATTEATIGAATDWWPLLAALALAVALTLAAFLFQSRRDFGQGLIAPRPGPATGGLVTSIWGLAFRLNRATVVSWLVGLTALGALFGNLAGSMGQLVARNPALAHVLAARGSDTTDLTTAFLGTILQIIAVVAGILGVQVIMRIHAEEVALRAESLYAGALRRQVYLASNVLVAMTGTALGMLLAGTALGLVGAQSSGVAAGTVLGQAAATIPGVWVLVALAVAAIGAAPRVRLVGWMGLVATFAVTLLGPMFRFPDWALGLSPLHHIPFVSAPSPAWSELVWLLLVTAGLLAVGYAGYRRRDIA